MKYRVLSSNDLIETEDLYNLPVDTCQIYCERSKLTSLPNWNNLIILNHINCSGNYLTSLPNWENLKNIQYISCYYNNLTSLPNWETLTKLIEIDCTNN